MNFRRLTPEAVGAIGRELGLPLGEVMRFVEVAKQQRQWRETVAGGDHATLPDDETIAAWQEAEDDWMALVPERPRLVMPYQKLNAMLGNLYGGEILAIAGATASGKTTTTMNLCHHLAAQGTRIALAATEMTPREVQGYLCAMDNHFRPDDVIAGNYVRAAYGRMTEPEVKAKLNASREFFKRERATPALAPLLVRRRETWRASDLPALFADAERTRRDVVMIDHLSMFEHDLAARSPLLAEQKTLRTIKWLALEYDMAVVLIAQVNVTRHREGDVTNRFRPPELTHVFGGQFLSFIATAMVTVYRPPRAYLDDGTEVDRKVMMRFVQSGDAEQLLEPGVTGIAVAKHRRASMFKTKRDTLAYEAGYLFDERPNFHHWIDQSPAALRATPMREPGED